LAAVLMAADKNGCSLQVSVGIQLQIQLQHTQQLSHAHQVYRRLQQRHGQQNLLLFLISRVVWGMFKTLQHSRFPGDHSAEY